DGEEIPMRMITFRRARATVARLPKIRSDLQRARGQLPARGIAGVERQLGHVRRNVDDDPVPEATAGRRVGVETRHGETPGPVRSAGPPELRRFVPAAAPEAVVRGQDVVGTEIVAVLEARARD